MDECKPLVCSPRQRVSFNSIDEVGFEVCWITWQATSGRSYKEGVRACAAMLQQHTTIESLSFMNNGISEQAAGRGLHSSTFQLNVSASHGIESVLRGCFGGVEEVLWGIKWVFRVYWVYEMAQVVLKSGRV